MRRKKRETKERLVSWGSSSYGDNACAPSLNPYGEIPPGVGPFMQQGFPAPFPTAPASPVERRYCPPRTPAAVRPYAGAGAPFPAVPPYPYGGPPFVPLPYVRPYAAAAGPICYDACCANCYRCAAYGSRRACQYCRRRCPS